MSDAIKEKNGAKFIKKFTENIKSNGAADIEYDAKANTLTATFKYGSAKAKIANVDMKVLMEKVKFLIYGGGLALLGYNVNNPASKPDKKLLPSKLELDRWALLGKIDSKERDMLFQKADMEYVLSKYNNKISESKKQIVK